MHPTCNVDLSVDPGTEQARLQAYLRVLEACSRTPVENNILRLQLRKLWESQSAYTSKFSIIRPLAEAIANGVVILEGSRYSSG